MGRIRALIVDDYPVVREGLRTMLSTDRTVQVVGEASDGAEAVAMVAEKKPNVVLMDIRMPNMDGIEATRQIKDKYPSTAVIVLTMYDSDAHVIDAVRAGASGYLLKDVSRELLLHTIRTVSSGTTLIRTDLLFEAISSLIQPKQAFPETEVSTIQALEELTPREREVLQLVTEGHTNKEIGKALSVSEVTIKKHMQNILAKLDTTNRAGAVAKVTRAGFIK
jgi:DNA-binding NarL/FixJ family response regulator